MTDASPRVAVLSVHTSPMDQPGSGDSGGMNVYIREVAERVARRGLDVDQGVEIGERPAEKERCVSDAQERSRGLIEALRKVLDLCSQGAERLLLHDFLGLRERNQVDSNASALELEELG